MEAPICASLGAMGSLLGKLDEILATEHKEEIWKLREDLAITRTLLLKLSKARDPPVTARYWMKYVRELSYDLEDCVDAEIDRIQEKMPGFKTRVEELNELYHRYMLEDSVPSCAAVAIDHRLPAVDGRKAVVGLDGPIDRLCQLLSDQDPVLKVVSIVGVAGIGKTTLAEQLWHKLGAFQCRAFVQTSKKPDMRGILRSILSQVRPHQPPPGVSDVRNLTQEIYQHLQDKSYFVIIDDLWATSVWEVVSRAFPEGNHGSRIVTTTETEDVALACCAYQSRYIFQMEPLSVQHSEELFTSALFGSGEEQLDKCSHEIMRRCGGLPQAIVSIASILASNRETETVENTEKAEQLNILQNFVPNDLEADTPFEEVLKQVLNLCYNCLPSCLQTCLLYLSVYPENYIIFKEDLAKQWIVEGFVCASTKKETMELALSYFDKLVNMGLIRHIDVKNSDEVLSYAVHHMVHDFITSKSIEENFVTVMDYSESTIQLSDRVRRLSIQFGSAAYATTPASTRLSHVRSLTFIGLLKCLPSISEFKLLRVLILNSWGDQGSTSLDLTRISELLLLRYLQIICNVIVQLPDQMQGLEHLETLEINARPDWSLSHLRLGGGTDLPEATMYPSGSSTSISSSYPVDPVKTFELLLPICSLPKWIGQLNKLCTLKIVVRELLKDDISSLGRLPALTVLSLYVRRHTAEIIVFNTSQFAALEYFEFKCGVLSLAFQEGAMPNLQMLKLGFNAHKGEQYGHFLEGIEHLSNLKEVAGIIGVAGGAEEPDWRSAKSAFKDAIPQYPKLDSEVNVKRADWIEEEYCSPENQHFIQERYPPIEQPGKVKEESDKDIKQHLIQEKYPPIEQPGKVKEESDKDIKQHLIQEKHPPSEQLGKIKEESNEDIKQNADSESASALSFFLHPDTKQKESISRNGAASIFLAVSKIGTVLLNEAVLAVINKLSRKVPYLKELPAKIKKIDKELKMMNDVIQDLGTAHLGNNVMKGLIANVRELAYHVEDVMDKCSYEAVKLMEEGFLYRYAFGGSRNIKVFSKIADEVIEIEDEIRHVNEVLNCWSNTVRLIKNEHADIDSKRYEGCFPELVNDEELVGIDENRRKLTEWLTTDEKESTVITVSGIRGLGKTTLVKNVYDREKANFPDAHAWIVVSQAYDVVDLLQKLLTKLRHTQSPPPPVTVDAKADIYELTEAIRKILRDRKYLIVLDDVWDISAYTHLCSACQGLQGSRIMITTRKEDVAALAPLGRRLLLQPLGRAESFQLFCSRAFHNSRDRKCPPQLETVAAAVVDRCRGLPLAIVSSGSLFSTKEKTEHAWNQMYDQLRSELREKPHVEAILNLSYHDLPGDLRNCLLYCSLFPQGYPMPRESLVRLWVAEGFVMKKDNSTPEEVADGNLMELIGRNMLEVVEKDELFRVSICRMHDIVRDLALDIAKEESFGSASDQGEIMRMDREVRRFSTCSWSDSSKTTVTGVEFPRLRTFVSIASSTNMLSSILSGSRYLTVLELQDSAINQVPASIGNLFNLRYIGLRRTNVKSLPDTIDKLSNLETLDVKQTKIEKLPPGIVKVEKLRHLFADRFADENQTEFRYFVGVEAPKKISNFQELQTLETVHASKDMSLQLKKMSKLQNVWIDNISASNCEELFRALSNLPELSSIVLCACDENEIFSFQALKPISKRLHRLIVRGGWSDGTLKCPIFQGHGRNLKYLDLSWCNLGTEDPLQLLASHVPALTYLSLNTVSSAGILVLSAGCFSQLRTLVLKRMPNVKQLVIDEYAIPSIEGIYVVSLHEMNMVPHGIESLGSLKKLWLLDLHKDFKAHWTVCQMYDKMMHVPELRT